MQLISITDAEGVSALVQIPDDMSIETACQVIELTAEVERLRNPAKASLDTLLAQVSKFRIAPPEIAECTVDL